MTHTLYSLRQSAASLFACALIELFPSAELMESDVDQIGFTYAFRLSQPLEEGVLVLFEEKMRAIAKEGRPVEATEMMRENAMGLFRHLKQNYKAGLIGQSLFNIVPVLKIGDSFYDYGTPPYVLKTSDLIAFKLQKLELMEGERGVFRVSGTAFSDTKALKTFLKKYESAKKSDHCLLGQELGLFSLEPDLGKDAWFWRPKGAFIREALLSWWKKMHKEQGFEFILTPRVIKDFELKKKVFMGHRPDKAMKVEGDLALSPSIEALHAWFFHMGSHSDQELPVRYAEVVEHYRENASSGSGLFDPTVVTIDREHIFCLHQQILDELISSLQFIEKTVNILGFECQWSLCLRGQKFAGTVEKWDKVLDLMRSALKTCKCEYTTDSSGKNFEGPEVVVRLKDSLGREWDGPFVRVDFAHSQGLDLSYRGANGAMHQPYMISRSMFGVLERYIAVLIEQCGGMLPLWLSYEPVRLLPIGESHYEFASLLCSRLIDSGVRCCVDYRKEPLGTKVHAVEREKVPFTVVIGNAEQKEGVLNVRSCSKQGQTYRIKIADFVLAMQEEAKMPELMRENT